MSNQPDRWRDDQVRIPVHTGDGPRSIAVHRSGTGPATVFLHGYPSWSGDWAAVATAVADHRLTLAADFLGFGYSDKPTDHRYSIFEQADVVQAVCGEFGITRAAVVAHDYGSTVAQELISRVADGTATIELDAVVFTNGGIYPDLHRPTDGQKLLLSADGAAVAAALDEAMFSAGVRPTFGRPPSEEAMAAMWAATDHERGAALAHELLHYIADRRAHGDRWVHHMETTDIPLAFVWGMLDPVSGAHMHERIAERMGRSLVVALDDVGHWPPLEAPDAVVAALEAIS